MGLYEQRRGNASGALRLFRQGAEGGDGKAMERLADAAPEAVEWLALAADFTTEAMWRSHLLYERKGNATLSELFLERAARMGHETAMRSFVEPLAKAGRWEDDVAVSFQ